MQKAVLVSAHRGNSAFFPENTMVAFKSALTMPVDMLEFDLHMTRDKQIIMMHDHQIDRTTDGTGLIKALSMKEIKDLDAGSWKGEQFKGTQVPAFDEFLDLLQTRPDIGMCVELKDYPKNGVDWALESAEKSIALIERYGVADRCVLNSFSGELLEYIDKKFNHRYKLHGYYPTKLLGGNMCRDPYDFLYCMCIFGTAESPVASRDAFNYAISRNVKPWVYYPDDSQQSYATAIEYGAELITANDPERALLYLCNRGLHR